MHTRCRTDRRWRTRSTLWAYYYTLVLHVFLSCFSSNFRCAGSSQEVFSGKWNLYRTESAIWMTLIFFSLWKFTFQKICIIRSINCESVMVILSIFDSNFHSDSFSYSYPLGTSMRVRRIANVFHLCRWNLSWNPISRIVSQNCSRRNLRLITSRTRPPET